jgi:hypothetical protein
MELLAEIRAIFAEPSDLPPPRQLCHCIRLLLGTTPVAVRPYRYARGQKAELERQCTEMLQQDVIRPSSLTFSAPVLVKKSNNSWRFCVDYRVLNDRMVFPRLFFYAKNKDISVVQFLANNQLQDQLFLPLSVEAFQEYQQLQQITQQIQISDHDKDSWSYIWGNNRYTSSTFYHFPYKNVQSPTSLYLDLGYKMFQQD